MHGTLPLLIALLVVGTECFTGWRPHERYTAARDWKTSLSVLVEPPRKGPSDEFASESDAPNLQPIRRLRRDKKEPLIAIVGRPNVVSSSKCPALVVFETPKLLTRWVTG